MLFIMTEERRWVIQIETRHVRMVEVAVEPDAHFPGEQGYGNANRLGYSISESGKIPDGRLLEDIPAHTETIVDVIGCVTPDGFRIKKYESDPKDKDRFLLVIEASKGFRFPDSGKLFVQKVINDSGLVINSSWNGEEHHESMSVLVDRKPTPKELDSINKKLKQLKPIQSITIQKALEYHQKKLVKQGKK